MKIKIYKHKNEGIKFNKDNFEYKSPSLIETYNLEISEDKLNSNFDNLVNQQIIKLIDIDKDVINLFAEILLTEHLIKETKIYLKHQFSEIVHLNK